MNKTKNWHQSHFETLEFGSRLADAGERNGLVEIHHHSNTTC
jgi:hypothetical protein